MNSRSLSYSNQQTIDWLDTRRGKIISGTGGWFPGKGVFSHGYSMLDELVGEKSYFQILILNATGKMVSRELAYWVECIYGCLSWPDPRIWCNQIGLGRHCTHLGSGGNHPGCTGGGFTYLWSAHSPGRREVYPGRAEKVPGGYDAG
jgi:hypothetical protein